MSAAGEGSTEPILYLRLLAQMQTSLATQIKSCMLVTFHAKGSLFASFC